MIQSSYYELETDESPSRPDAVRRWLVEAQSVVEAVGRLRDRRPDLVVVCAFPSNITDLLVH